MTNQFLTLTSRMFQRRKAYYVVNLLSITVGLVAAGLTFLYVDYELTYDDFHTKANRIYRVSGEQSSGWFASMTTPYSNAIHAGTIPEVESASRTRRWFSKFLYVGDQKFYESKVLITDPGSSFLSIFDFPLVEGNRESALKEPNSVIISSSLAKKYFGSKSALGEAVRLDTIDLKVTAVFEDIPGNSNFDFELMATNQAAMDRASGHFMFVLLNEGTKPGDVAGKIKAMPVATTSFSELKDVKLIPLPKLHFEGDMTFEQKTPGKISYLVSLTAIGITVLIISVSNFVNLSIALYAYRSKEIAVRKSLGATGKKLALQFFAESAVTISVAALLALTTISLLLPAFNDFLQVKVGRVWSGPLVAFLLATAGMIAGLVSIYPVTFLPGLRVLDLLKSSGITNHHGLRLRQVLLAVQFAILFFVSISLWVIHHQFELIGNKDLGFDKEGVVKITRSWNVDSTDFWRLKAELKSNNAISFVSEGLVPGDEDYGFTFRAENSLQIQEGMTMLNTDYEYLKVLDIQPLEGLIASNTTGVWPRRSCVINETAARILGYKDAVGKKFVLHPGQDDERTVTIDGVVRDFHFRSLHETVGPHVFFMVEKSKYVDENILVKVTGKDVRSTVSFIEKKVADIIPDIPVGIEFLQEDLNRLYIRDQKTSDAVQVLVAITILLAFTGLVALCSYMIGFRMREIAIRKVLGAADFNIITLFSKGFIVMIAVSFVVGGAVAYVSMQQWVQTFAYRIEISPVIFGIVFLAVAALTLLLAAVQVIRATRINPVTILHQD